MDLLSRPSKLTNLPCFQYLERKNFRQDSSELVTSSMAKILEKLTSSWVAAEESAANWSILLLEEHLER